MRVPLVRGRLFEGADRLSEDALTTPAEQARQRPRGVVLATRRRCTHSGLARIVGRAIRLFYYWAVASSVVVGVVGAMVRATGVATPAEPAIYLPWGEMPGFRLAVAARVRPGIESIGPTMQARLRALDPQLLVSGIRPMDAVVSGALSRPRFNMVLVAGFALLALTLRRRRHPRRRRIPRRPAHA